MCTCKNNEQVRHRSLFALVALGFGFVAGPIMLGSPLAFADTYPSKPITMIVPFAPGGPVDLTGRQVAQKLAETLKQPVVVENRPGANGTTATAQITKSTPDGYTILMMSGSHTANASIYAKLAYDPLKDFIPITQISQSGGNAIVVHPDFPANTIQEFMALAKANPGKYTYGHGGIGNATHIGPELLFAIAGVKLVSVPYTGGGGPIAAVLGKEVDVSYSSPTAVISQIKSGRMKALVIASTARSPVLPNVPTVAEAGYPDAAYEGYYGLWFPKDVPADRLEIMNKAAVQAIRSPEVTRFVTDGGAKVVANSPAEFAKFLEADIALHASIVKRINFKPVQ